MRKGREGRERERGKGESIEHYYKLTSNGHMSI